MENSLREYCSRRVVVANKGMNYQRQYQNNNNHLSAQCKEINFERLLKTVQLKEKHLLARTKDVRAQVAIKKQYMNLAVRAYPNFSRITGVCLQRVQALGGTDFVPQMGGVGVETLKALLSWKTTRFIQDWVWRFKKVGRYSQLKNERL